MTDPATRTDHETDQEPQDGEVVEPHVPLARFLAWVRVLAGRRGHARVTWWGLGFRYTLVAERRPPSALVIERDRSADAEGGTIARDRLRDSLS